jgi:hypothetical protein
MYRICFIVVLSMLFIEGWCQPRDINKLTLQKTYTMEQIHKSLRDLIDKADKSSYFDDDFFNSLLKKIVQDRQFTEKEKVQLFYLMQKKIGYAFIGIEYLPPQLNYFQHHNGKVFIFEKTKLALLDLKINPKPYLMLVDSNMAKDAILASNALFLACLLNSDSVAKRLEYYSQASVINKVKNPEIFNHYVCLGASVIQNKTIADNLVKNLKEFTNEGFLEDVLCGLYAKNYPVSQIREYILSEKDPQNDLAVQTALCALASKVPEASFEQSLKSLIAASTEKWKTDICKDMLNNKIPFNYSLTAKDQLVTKTWKGVNVTIYNDGTYIINGSLIEFDPN